MKESQFCLELKKSLRKYGWFIKFHGGQFTEPGVPDLIGCIKGRFVAIECKVNGGQLSEHQRQQIANIQVYANGSSYVIMLQKDNRNAKVYQSIFLLNFFNIPRLAGGVWDVSKLVEDILL
jgi:Holliday junction resolvase